VKDDSELEDIGKHHDLDMTRNQLYLRGLLEMHGSPPRTDHEPVDFDPILPDIPNHEPLPQLDDIKVEYHPHSQIPSTIHPFSEFSRLRPVEDSMPRNNTPWEPFRTRLDFEVAEIALEAALSKDQTNRLFDIVHRSASGKDVFTLQNHDEARKIWQMASQRFTGASH